MSTLNQNNGCTPTGPFKLLNADDKADPKYLLMEFDDGNTRKMAKGGNWPPNFAKALFRKAHDYIGHEVLVLTWRADIWDTTEWLRDIKPFEGG